MRAPIRVLRSVGHLSRGGIENWLFQLASRMDRSRFEHHVLVRTDKEEAFTRAFREAGIPVIPCLGVKSPLEFYRNFKQVLRDHGPYDVLHAHGFSFLTTQALLFAKLQGIRVRILHGHNDLKPRLAHASLTYKSYAGLNLMAIRKLANCGIACGFSAAEWTFGNKWKSRKPPVDLIIGIDLEPCFGPADPELHIRLNLPSDRFIIAQIGRYGFAKNHVFTVEVARELNRRNVPFHLLLIGDGDLRPDIEKLMEVAGLRNRCTFVPDTDQVPKILRSAVDLQILPSLHEGLGLVLVEAQASGVPSLVSDAVTREGVIDKGLVRFLPIDEGPGVWADAIGDQLATSAKRTIDAQHRERMLASRFNIHNSVQQLSRIYEELVRGGMTAKET